METLFFILLFLTAYSFAVYPAALWGVSALVRRPWEEGRNMSCRHGHRLRPQRRGGDRAESAELPRPRLSRGCRRDHGRLRRLDGQDRRNRLLRAGQPRQPGRLSEAGQDRVPQQGRPVGPRRDYRLYRRKFHVPDRGPRHCGEELQRPGGRRRHGMDGVRGREKTGARRRASTPGSSDG